MYSMLDFSWFIHVRECLMLVDVTNVLAYLSNKWISMFVQYLLEIHMYHPSCKCQYRQSVHWIWH